MREARAVTRTIVPEKLAQARAILGELDVDLWLLAARESDLLGDPSLPLVVGTSVTWESFFLIPREGEPIAIVGTGDVENIKQTGAWADVRGYVQSSRELLVGALDAIAPRQLALNYSPDNNIADGLTYGMYLKLAALLDGTPYFDRVISGAPVASRLRARKSAEEQRRIRTAVQTTEEIWRALEERLRPGFTEVQVADFMHSELERRGIGSSWDWHYCPSVTAGPNSPVGHVGPVDLAVEPGQLLAIDFGVRQDEYCSDMQRTYYMLREGEQDAPEPVQQAFRLVAGAIREAARALRPGVQGWEIDAVAREMFAREGADDWAFALGHQLGRACHDGGCVLGPRWERYGGRPYETVEQDEVYTLEIGVTVPGYGRVSLEEDVLVTADGCEFLAPPQEKPILIG